MKYFSKKIDNQSGMATLEMLLAMVIIILAISTVILLVSGSQDTTVSSQTNQEALYKAQKQIEDARNTARADFGALMTTSPTPDDIYTKSVTITPDSSNPDFSKIVTSLVQWGANQVKLVTKVTDWNSVLGICNPTVSIGWDHPQAYPFDSASDLVVQATGNNSNGLGIADTKVQGKKMYLAANHTANDNNDFYVFGITSNPAQVPTYLGRTNTVGRSNNYALKSVAIEDNGINIYAYVANAVSFDFSDPSCTNTTCPQFQVIDVTDASNPTVVSTGNLKMPITANNSCGANCIGGAGTGNVIYYYQGYVYLGLVKPTTGPEFHIIDVGGGSLGYSPTNPHRVGGYTVGRTIESIYVKGNFAYITTDDNAGGNKQLLVLDVSDKNLDPLPIETYFTAPGIGYGRGVIVSGEKIYFSRTGSSSPNFYVLNGSIPFSTPLPTSSSRNTSSSDSINSVAVRSNLAFLLINNTTLSNSRFQVLNLSNNNANYGAISLQSIVAQIQGNGNNFSGSSTLSCTGNYFYVPIQTNGVNKDILATIGPGSNYTLNNSGDITVTQGSSGSNTITSTIISGFPPTATLSNSVLPTGATRSYTNNPCTPNCSSQLTIDTISSTPPGTYPITITGTGGVTTIFDLIINSTPTFDYSLSASPVSKVLNQGSSYDETITVTKIGTATSQLVTVTLSGFQNNVTVSAPSSCTPNPTCNIVFTINAASNAQKKTNTITVSGTSPVRTTTFSLQIQ